MVFTPVQDLLRPGDDIGVAPTLQRPILIKDCGGLVNGDSQNVPKKRVASRCELGQNLASPEPAMNCFRRTAILFCLLSLSGGAVFAAGTQGRELKMTPTRHGNVVKLKDLARYLDLNLTRDTKQKAIHLQGEHHAWTFYENSRRVECNETLLWMHRPLTRSWRAWAVSEIDVMDQFLPLARPGPYLREQGHETIVLDAGHGGHDRGGEGGKSMEKELALRLATKVRSQLVQEGFHVRLTREDDTFIALSNRCVVAAAMNADIFISIHFNASANGDATGIETFVLPPPGEESTSQNTATLQYDTYPGNRHQGANVILGQNLHEALLHGTDAEDRGLKKARFVVLREASCPAALLELGFLTNEEEEQRIREDDYFDRLSVAVSTGIRNYLRCVTQAKVMVPE